MAELEKENMELRNAPLAHRSSANGDNMYHGSKRTRDEGKYVTRRNNDGTFHDVPRQLGDFPEARYWYREDWGEADDEDALEPGKPTGPRGSSRMAKGENVRFGFITHTDGTAVSGHRIKELGHHFRDFCRLLKTKNICPSKWQGAACTDIKQACNCWMRSQSFELQLCENNWKSELFTIMVYPAWKQRNLGKSDTDTTQKHNKKSFSKGKGKESGFLPAALLEQAQWLIDDNPPESRVPDSESMPPSSAPHKSPNSDDTPTNMEMEPAPKRACLTAITDATTPFTSISTTTSGADAPTITDCGTGAPSANDETSDTTAVSGEPSQLPDALANWWTPTQEPSPIGPGPSEAPVAITTCTRARRGKKEWPPTLLFNKPKDICARYWAAENPTKTKTDFDTIYKDLGVGAKRDMKEKGQLADKLAAMPT
ncbi:hypothetical protein C2E23DRAFT_883101 [Lenzites betulinus]|nr:hypothetical protein C2E23DRAFT_883101 [Lenzites betulinus]